MAVINSDGAEPLRPEPPMSLSQALGEASRCLQCFDPPCTKACPAGIVIPRFIRMIGSSNIRGAAEAVRSSNPMALSCGLACPDEQLCAAACVRGKIDSPVEIRRLHRFASEREEEMRPRPPVVASPGKARVAVVGAGPAGLACAFELRRLGIGVFLFEARERIGGVLSSSIPLYRFPERAVIRDGSWALGIAAGKIAPARRGRTGGRRKEKPGVELRLRAPVADVEALAGEFDAVFVAPGLVAGRPGMEVEGLNLRGVSMADEFLERCRRAGYRNRVGSEVVVIGGGNVAVDAALAAVRCGEVRATRAPGVHLLYRRTRPQMPAWEREVRLAERVGVVIHFLVIPAGFIGEHGRLKGIRLTRAALGPEDAGGRPAPVPIPGSEFVLPCDQAVLATGMKLDRSPLGRLPVTRDGVLKAGRRTRRVRGNIFAGGDAAGTGADRSIVAAVRDGKLAAGAIAVSLGVKRALEPGIRR